jgi:hypothetical protein
MGRPVAFKAVDMLLKRWNEICGVPERPSLKQLSYSSDIQKSNGEERE